MRYEVYDLTTRNCISNDPNTSIILKPNGRIAYNDYGDEIEINNATVIFFPNENEDGYIDDVGGIHDCGVGYDPAHNFCGECSFITCSECGIWANRRKGENT